MGVGGGGGGGGGGGVWGVGRDRQIGFQIPGAHWIPIGKKDAWLWAWRVRMFREPERSGVGGQGSQGPGTRVHRGPALLDLPA